MKLCTNCKHEDTDMNEWPCSMCDDNGYGPSKWEVKDSPLKNEKLQDNEENSDD